MQDINICKVRGLKTHLYILSIHPHTLFFQQKSALLRKLVSNFPCDDGITAHFLDLVREHLKGVFEFVITLEVILTDAFAGNGSMTRALYDV